MIPILCPICGAVLQQDPGSWSCPLGHRFDVARQGYVNLLPVTQKHSRHPGDTREQVAARKEFLDSGVYRPIAETLCALLRPLQPGTVLDVGCGEGYYLTELMAALPGLRCAGVDISKDAVRYAAVRNRSAVFLTATASHLPFADGTFDTLLSLFALTLPDEFARVLQPGGVFLQVTAGREHLLSLKSLIYGELHEKAPKEDPTLPGFSLLEEKTLEFSFTLESGAEILHLLAMTPHYLRITKEGLQRAQAAAQLTDRAQVLFRVYRRMEP